MTQAPPPADMTMQRTSRDPAQVRVALSGWLAATLPAGADPEVTLHESAEANGMSSETMPLAITQTVDGVRRTTEHVVRIAPRPADLPVFPSYRLQDQHAAMRLAASLSGAPVPKVSGLEATGGVLEALGIPSDEARRTLERFKEYDEALLLSTFEYHRDEKRLMEAANRARQELEQLFEKDAAERRSA